METPQPEKKPNRNLIMGVIAAIVLCCCCTVTAVGGYYGYQAYLAAQTAAEALEDLEIPSELTDPSNIPGFDGSEAPQGGRSDPTTRSTAWLSLQIVAAVSGCTTPTAEGSTITVLQEPDAGGVWVEEWNVNCGDGTSKPFKITFTPDASGFVTPYVELQ